MLKLQWMRETFQVKGSVIRSVSDRVVFCAFFGYIISLLFHFGFPVAWPLLGFVPNIILGLLLVFRTNTAYERFWEGRRLWGGLTNTVRNLARQIWIAVEEKEPQDAANKVVALRLLVAFAVATKLHLRQEQVNSEIETLMPPEQYVKLKEMNNPPLEVAFWIGDYLQKQYERGCLDSYQLASMYRLLNELVDILGGCERILRTPMPLAYAIHLKQLLLIYCLFLPFDMVSKLNWWTAPVVALVSFMLFGIEEIGVEIENPFGHDPNDLPLDTLCATMRRNIEDIISLKPSVRYSSVESRATSVD